MAFGAVCELHIRAAGVEGSVCQLREFGMELLLELSQPRIEERGKWRSRCLCLLTGAGLTR